MFADTCCFTLCCSVVRFSLLFQVKCSSCEVQLHLTCSVRFHKIFLCLLENFLGRYVKKILWSFLFLASFSRGDLISSGHKLIT